MINVFRIKNILDRVIDHTTTKIEFNRNEIKQRITELFEDHVSYFNETASKDRQIMEDLGVSPHIIERRKKVLLDAMEGVENHLPIPDKSKYVYPLSFSLLTCELLFEPYYSEIHYSYNIDYAIALWILDELKLANKLEDAYKYLPDDPFDNNIIPPKTFRDTTFDYELVNAIVYTIRNRNGNLQQTLVNDSIAKGTHLAVNSEGRSNYSRLLSLIPISRIQKACDYYTRKLKELMDIIVYSSKVIEEKKLLLMNRYMAGYNTLKTMLSPLYNPSISDINKIDEIEVFLSSFEKKMFDNNVKQRHLIENICDYVSLGYSEEEDPLEEIKDIIHKEDIIYKIENFHISDPFAICFAIHFLLDNNDDRPWLFVLSSVVLSRAGHILPWARKDIEEDSDSDKEPSHDLYQTNIFSNSDSINALPLFLSNHNDEINVAQAVYNITGRVLPRYLYISNDSRNLINKWIADPKDRECILILAGLLSTTNAKLSKYTVDYYSNNTSKEVSIFHESDNLNMDSSEAENDNSSLSDIEPNNIEEKYLAEIKELKRALKEQAHNEKQKTEKLEKVIEKYQQEINKEKQHPTDLQELYIRDEMIEEEESLEQKISFPYRTTHNIVVIGGHESFVNTLHSFIPDLRFIKASSKAFDHRIIRNADLIFLQNNRMSHSQYYAVAAEAKSIGKEILYFNNASARKAAEMIAKEDMKIQQ